MKLNLGIKMSWTQALRSGEYRQGRGCLRPSPTTYCCLGVLDEISGGVCSGGSDYLLSRDVIERYIQITLVDLNDAQQRSFSKIADWIEENL